MHFAAGTGMLVGFGRAIGKRVRSARGE
jgi:hypothetical protein